MPESRPPKIMDYEGSQYRTEFWEGQGREYEDRVERLALQRLLPKRGRRVLEIGAGFGRLSNEFDGYEQVVLLDYSLSQLQYARDHYGDSAHFVYVAADAYRLPFKPGVFDGATMIRVVHHMADVPAVLRQVRRVLVPGAVFILEHANKQNLKAMMRYALGQQEWSPYTRDPVEFVELNFDFHPSYILDSLKHAGFSVKQQVPVSFFRLEKIKSVLPTEMLVSIDGLLQQTGFPYTPSLFVKSVAMGQSPINLESDNLFLCPQTGGALRREGDMLVGADDGPRYAIRDGIYDFKAPVEGG
jgi:SAM-dependent methyltransferase